MSSTISGFIRSPTAPRRPFFGEHHGAVMSTLGGSDLLRSVPEGILSSLIPLAASPGAG